MGRGCVRVEVGVRVRDACGGCSTSGAWWGLRECDAGCRGARGRIRRCSAAYGCGLRVQCGVRQSPHGGYRASRMAHCSLILRRLRTYSKRNIQKDTLANKSGHGCQADMSGDGEQRSHKDTDNPIESDANSCSLVMGYR